MKKVDVLRKLISRRTHYEVCYRELQGTTENFGDINRMSTWDQLYVKGLLDYAIKIAATWVVCKKLHARIARPFTLRIYHRAIFKTSVSVIVFQFMIVYLKSNRAYPIFFPKAACTIFFFSKWRYIE